VAKTPRLALAVALAAVLLSGLGAAPAHAEEVGGLIGGVGDIIGAAFSLPAGILQGTLSGPPSIGTLGGALSGALNTMSLALRGVLRLAGVAIPMAAKAAPLIPLFL